MKRLVFTSVPEETTRLAMLKRGEADITYALQGQVAEEARQTPSVRLIPVMLGAIWWLDFPSSGTPNRPGTTCVCARPPAWRWIGRP